jgi:uncharacterized protein (DUF1330 family)
MAAYVVITRKDPQPNPNGSVQKLAPASFQQHPATFLDIHGRHEVLEGLAVEEIIILEFPTFDTVKAWYHRPKYQAACEHRFQGGDYCWIIP